MKLIFFCIFRLSMTERFYSKSNFQDILHTPKVSDIFWVYRLIIYAVGFDKYLVCGW